MKALDRHNQTGEDAAKMASRRKAPYNIATGIN